ncbi:unnamed protein product, partial [Dibothriocephalus latus]
VPARSKPAPAAQQFPTVVSVPADEQRSAPAPPKPAAKPVKDDLPDVYDDELTLVITKKKAELPGFIVLLNKALVQQVLKATAITNEMRIRFQQSFEVALAAPRFFLSFSGFSG